MLILNLIVLYHQFSTNSHTSTSVNGLMGIRNFFNMNKNKNKIKVSD